MSAKVTTRPIALFVALSVFGLAPGPASAEIIYAWTQVGPESRLIVRAVTDGSPCPTLAVNGRELSLRERSAPDSDFDTRVCETSLPAGAREVVLEGQDLPLLPDEVRRIALIGDTGCRLKGEDIQACNDPDRWPFAKIARQVADHGPDLVIHLGDYLYRQAACPASADCQGSPYGFNGPTWDADWLAPAQALFGQVPLLLLRGNHEQCGRASRGWQRYVSVGPIAAQCPEAAGVWKARLTELELIVFDSSSGGAAVSDPAYEGLMRRMAERAFADLDGETWLLTHRPLWAHIDPHGPEGDSTQRSAFSGLMGEDMTLILSGHLHSFQLSDMKSGPSQIISGNSGTKLDPTPNAVLHDIVVGGDAARNVVGDSGFGFQILERGENGNWQLTVFDVDGKQRHSCVVVGQNINCGRDAATP